MSFARLVLTTASVSAMPQASVCILPQREFAIGLVQECIQKIFIIYPILSDTLVFGSMEAAYQHNGRYCPPQDCWNTRMVLAIACLCRSQAKGDIHYQNAVSHASVALVQREAVLQPGSIATVQATLLLVIYSMMDPSHFSSRFLIGVAARVMVDIGLHQDPAADEQSRLKPAQLELRRRIFFCVYALDRYFTDRFVPSSTDKDIEPLV